MRIVWDPPKREADLADRGLDFADLTVEFFLTSIVRRAKSGRSQAIGRFGDGFVSVIFARLGSEAVSVISMRAASKKERRLL